MAGLEVLESVQLTDGYEAPSCEASGAIRSARFHPEGFSLWEVEAELGPGAELRWDTEHGDEVVYVLDGSLEVAGSGLGPRDAAIVEGGVAARAHAPVAARILHFGPTSAEAPNGGPLGPASTSGRRVHVVAMDAAENSESADGERSSLHYADSTCETCRLAFFENEFRTPAVVGSHTHTQDEIVRMTSGEIQMGRVTLRAGMSAAIPGGYRYGFRGTVPFSFLNYRRDVSTYMGAPGTDPLLETIESVRAVRSGRIPID